MRYSVPRGRRARGISGGVVPVGQMRVTQHRPLSRPMTTCGTISTLVWAEEASKAKAPKASRPVPVLSIGSDTVAAAATSRQAVAASVSRVAPENSSRRAVPMPARPWLRRIQSSGARVSSRRISWRMSAMGVVSTVRA